MAGDKLCCNNVSQQQLAAVHQPDLKRWIVPYDLVRLVPRPRFPPSCSPNPCPTNCLLSTHHRLILDSPCPHTADAALSSYGSWVRKHKLGGHAKHKRVPRILRYCNWTLARPLLQPDEEGATSHGQGYTIPDTALWRPYGPCTPHLQVEECTACLYQRAYTNRAAQRWPPFPHPYTVYGPFRPQGCRIDLVRQLTPPALTFEPRTQDTRKPKGGAPEKSSASCL